MVAVLLYSLVYILMLHLVYGIVSILLMFSIPVHMDLYYYPDHVFLCSILYIDWCNRRSSEGGHQDQPLPDRARQCHIGTGRRQGHLYTIQVHTYTYYTNNISLYTLAYTAYAYTSISYIYNVPQQYILTQYTLDVSLSSPLRLM